MYIDDVQVPGGNNIPNVSASREQSLFPFECSLLPLSWFESSVIWVCEAINSASFSAAALRRRSSSPVIRRALLVAGRPLRQSVVLGIQLPNLRLQRSDSACILLVLQLQSSCVRGGIGKSFFEMVRIGCQSRDRAFSSQRLLRQTGDLTVLRELRA